MDSTADNTSDLPLQGDELLREIPRYPGSDFYPNDFLEVLETTIQHTIKEHTSGALMLVSITNLSMIISASGHDTSEIVMHDLMKMMQDVLSEHDTVQRLQRDQFGIILANAHAEDVQNIAYRLYNVIQNFGRDNYATAALYVIGVIGSIVFPTETASACDALDKVYVAINSTVTAPHRTYEMTCREADQNRQSMGLANYLFKAFKEKRLRLAYQPVVESKTGKIGHYEALLRLVSPNGKISSAGPLIPVAEKMGLIDTIDTMVMEMVIEELRHDPNVVIAFNVSNMTTENDIWLDQLTILLKETPIIAPRLIVELTETAVHRDLRRTAFFVASLQSMGCQVALDDFGSGYTSFRQLKALSVDMVKIDGIFIKDLPNSADNQFFVKTLLDFSQAFGLKTVAEFVENGETAKILMEMGADYLQGFYFGKPANHRAWLNEGEYGLD
ncbi:MAG: GGDEF domain-containing phosphodiesterase [Rickettsiales bacterium]|nr:GGDEF domain-containing phosphodiesterase [Rickettsiales bacterium]